MNVPVYATILVNIVFVIAVIGMIFSTVMLVRNQIVYNALTIHHNLIFNELLPNMHRAYFGRTSELIHQGVMFNQQDALDEVYDLIRTSLVNSHPAYEYLMWHKLDIWKVRELANWIAQDSEVHKYTPEYTVQKLNDWIEISSNLPQFEMGAVLAED